MSVPEERLLGKKNNSLEGKYERKEKRVVGGDYNNGILSVCTVGVNKTVRKEVPALWETPSLVSGSSTCLKYSTILWVMFLCHFSFNSNLDDYYLWSLHDMFISFRHTFKLIRNFSEQEILPYYINTSYSFWAQDSMMSLNTTRLSLIQSSWFLSKASLWCCIFSARCLFTSSHSGIITKPLTDMSSLCRDGIFMRWKVPGLLSQEGCLSWRFAQAPTHFVVF